MATTVAVALSTSVVASAAEGCVAGLMTALLPQPWLWWPKAAEDVGPLRIESQEDVFAWVDRNGREWKPTWSKFPMIRT